MPVGVATAFAVLVAVVSLRLVVAAVAVVSIVAAAGLRGPLFIVVGMFGDDHGLELLFAGDKPLPIRLSSTDPPTAAYGPNLWKIIN